MRVPSGEDPPVHQYRLPVGIQTFRRIREGGYYYVDKTDHAQRLVDQGGIHHFLSRPRRFGKSLFVDTLKELYEGSEELFQGLAVHKRWNWSARHPVVRLSFARGDFKEPGYLDEDVTAQLAVVELDAGLEPEHASAPLRFARLIRLLAEQAGRKVVVLVDEYDKPVLDALVAAPDIARANRDYLRGLYATLKDSEACIEFSFLTGVSKFSRTSLFSGLNNLVDLTLDPDHSAICGYTEADLDAVFAPELDGLDRDRIREWYNGYSWLGEHRVYNPFGILLLFRNRKFRAWWFETATPTFLVDTLRSRGVFPVDLERMHAGDELLSAFDVDEIEPEALLFQTGYLTITGEGTGAGEGEYRLGYPNREVRESLNRRLLRHLVPGRETGRMELRRRLRELLESSDLDGLEELLRAVFAGIPHQWHTTSDIARHEAWFASVFYSCFLGSGLDVRVEDATNRGRIDMAVVTANHVHVFELKVLGPASEGDAMQQLRDRGHAEKYRGQGRRVHLVGVELDPRKRNVARFETASA